MCYAEKVEWNPYTMTTSPEGPALPNREIFAHGCEKIAAKVRKRQEELEHSLIDIHATVYSVQGIMPAMAELNTQWDRTQDLIGRQIEYYFSEIRNDTDPEVLKTGLTHLRRSVETLLKLQLRLEGIFPPSEDDIAAASARSCPGYTPDLARRSHELLTDHVRLMKLGRASQLRAFAVSAEKVAAAARSPRDFAKRDPDGTYRISTMFNLKTDEALIAKLNELSCEMTDVHQKLFASNPRSFWETLKRELGF